MSSLSNLDPEMRRRRYKIVRQKVNMRAMFLVHLGYACYSSQGQLIAPGFTGTTSRTQNKRPSQEDDVEMAGTEDERFNFNTVTEIYPREGYYLGTPDMEDEDPKPPEDDEDHEPPRLARLASLHASHLYPPSVSCLPSEYNQFDQDTIIKTYFDGFNPATPLFSEQDYEYFDTECRECREKGTVSIQRYSIYVMLALSLRNDPKNGYQGDDELFIRKASSYVYNMHHFSLSNEVTLQVLLGTALYFMTTPNLEQAGSVHARAVKLVYRLGLHKWSGDFAQLYPVRLVWIAYIMDRHLSLLTGEPYLMQGHDIASSVTEISYDEGGILRSEDKSKHFEILRFRAELATIQGKIFDLVYSVRASELSSDQRETVADRLDEMLEEWVESIPEAYRGDTLSGFGYVQLRFFKQLRVTYYHCIFSIRQATLRNMEWVKRLLKLGEARNGDDTDAPLLPSNWSGLVTAARRCLDIVSKVDSRDMAFRWSCTHATQAAMAILAANNITLSEHDIHDSTEKDHQRLHIAHGEVSDRLDEDPTGATEEAFNTCGELIIKAPLKMEELPIKPSGIFMQHDFITPEHEQELIHIFENELEWPNRGGRLSLHYGYTFSYKTFGIDEETPFKPFPDWLVPLLPTTEGRPPDQVCLQQYAPGTGIPPHVDTHGPFDQLYSLSLGSPLFMQFANKETGEKIEVDLLPRSMMQMSGDSRLHWTHGIKSRKTDTLPDGTVRLRQTRWSLTYRWLREGAECECGNERLCDTAQRRKGIEREYRWKQYEEDAKAPQS
ncbi:Alkylated DNA repair alkB like 8 [Fusarium phyllophilum]|uniref:Alkylated DNA repair alkB like 8 n=1 Tax=Fusarium phyllophilum TaxID=47803 RepID=A0A8H5N9Z1_9HYPO|nr:Alkylated DNA repair alkB like 8 [Fusarium phyllophilum]